MKTAFTIGRLRMLEVLASDGRAHRLSVKGKWLAWDGRRYVICTLKAKKADCALPANVVRMHTKFHGEPPKGAMIGELPDVCGKLQKVGVVKSLVYDVPGSVIRSPGKNPHQWHHAFGDTGHQGGDSYPVSVMPPIYTDANGDALFIKRSKGNIYTVDEWLRG
jgi:hypothetical protein